MGTNSVASPQAPAPSGFASRSIEAYWTEGNVAGSFGGDGGFGNGWAFGFDSAVPNEVKANSPRVSGGGFLFGEPDENKGDTEEDKRANKGGFGAFDSGFNGFGSQDASFSTTGRQIRSGVREEGTVCRFFAAGHCRRGRNCPFLHQRVGGAFVDDDDFPRVAAAPPAPPQAEVEQDQEAPPPLVFDEVDFPQPAARSAVSEASNANANADRETIEFTQAVAAFVETTESPPANDEKTFTIGEPFVFEPSVNVASPGPLEFRSGESFTPTSSSFVSGEVDFGHTSPEKHGVRSAFGRPKKFDVVPTPTDIVASPMSGGTPLSATAPGMLKECFEDAEELRLRIATMPLDAASVTMHVVANSSKLECVPRDVLQLLPNLVRSQAPHCALTEVPGLGCTQLQILTASNNLIREVPRDLLTCAI